MVILEPNFNQSTAHRPKRKKNVCCKQIRLFIDFSENQSSLSLTSFHPLVKSSFHHQFFVFFSGGDLRREWYVDSTTNFFGHAAMRSSSSCQDHGKPPGSYPICSMYGIFTYIYPKNHPNVGKYSIHGASGYEKSVLQGFQYLPEKICHKQGFPERL